MIADELKASDNSLGESTLLVLGILHEAVASFSRQRTLDDLWTSVCRNARWIVPCQRMAVLLAGGPQECCVAARIEAGKMRDRFDTGFEITTGLTGRLMENRGVQWITDFDTADRGHDALHDWLLEDRPAALITVPLKLEQKAVGALVFVLDSFSTEDQPLLNALLIGYSIYTSMAFGLLDTMTELQAARERQDLLLAEIEAKNVELGQRNTDIESKNQVLEAQKAELEQFTYTLSHDLKAPLVTISGFVGLLRKDLAARDESAVDGDLRQISSATDKMSRLLNELLDLSRIGRLTAKPERIPLSELAREAVECAEARIAERGIEVEIESDMPSAYGDPVRLREVFLNLVDNAVKFMGDEPGPKIKIGASHDAGQVQVYVSDNGIGIHPDYHQRIFGLFDRLDLEIDGTGVGLSLVKRIVEVHGGRIWVESEGAGCGSVFRFSLPLEAAGSRGA